MVQARRSQKGISDCCVPLVTASQKMFIPPFMAIYYHLLPSIYYHLLPFMTIYGHLWPFMTILYPFYIHFITMLYPCYIHVISRIFGIWWNHNPNLILAPQEIATDLATTRPTRSHLQQLDVEARGKGKIRNTLADNHHIYIYEIGNYDVYYLGYWWLLGIMINHMNETTLIWELAYTMLYHQITIFMGTFGDDNPHRS